MIFLLFFFCLLWTEPVFAGEQEENSEEAYLEEVFDQVDFSELDIFMEEDGIEHMTFSELVHQFMQGGINRDSLSDVALWVKSLLFQEITEYTCESICVKTESPQWVHMDGETPCTITEALLKCKKGLRFQI